VYVKNGIITWEEQQTDYPSVGPDRPEYEPRGCPRGAAFSWYTYSPTRVRYPYVRGVLLEAYRAAKADTGDPVRAWEQVVQSETRTAYQKARGKGGFVRVSWDEAVELVAADRGTRRLHHPARVRHLHRAHRLDRSGAHDLPRRLRPLPRQHLVVLPSAGVRRRGLRFQ
jgi:nitrate reductase alpha subunit